MATRTKIEVGTGIGTSFESIGSDVTPPDGIKWTLVEFSYAFGVNGTPANGQGQIKFDEEIYHTIDSDVHNTLGGENQKNKEIVAIDVIQPHKLVIQAKADAATISVTAQLTIEESAATA